jgi:hypothetical protein
MATIKPEVARKHIKDEMKAIKVGMKSRKTAEIHRAADRALVLYRYMLKKAVGESLGWGSDELRSLIIQVTNLEGRARELRFKRTGRWV